MRKAKIIFLTLVLVGTASLSHAQYNNSGISAGFFDSSENATISGIV